MFIELMDVSAAEPSRPPVSASSFGIAPAEGESSKTIRTKQQHVPISVATPPQDGDGSHGSTELVLLLYELAVLASTGLLHLIALHAALMANMTALPLGCDCNRPTT